MSKLYDEHTLFIKCDCASSEQINAAFNEMLTKYRNEHKTKIECRWRVNVVVNKENKHFGIAFVFVTNPAVYHMLLGKNPDGSDRVIYIDDPSWTAPSEGAVVNDAGWASIAEPVFTSEMSWAEISELEGEYNDALSAVNQKYVCPKIPVELEPLIKLPPFKLTSEQIEHKRMEIISNNEGKPGFDASLVEIPELAYFGVDRAMVTPLDEKFMHNVLKCTAVPDWITAPDLKALFTAYASDSRTEQERFIKGRRMTDTYPFVNINDDRVAFIIFDAQTTNAQFALHMMKKTLVKKANKEITLVFGYSCRTGRDIMSDISQQPRPVHRQESTVKKSPLLSNSPKRSPNLSHKPKSINSPTNRSNLYSLLEESESN